jgi:tRNA pseudouridine65 synthase
VSATSSPLITAAKGALEVLYQDEWLVVVNKPSGLAAHRGWSDEGGDYVLTRVRDAVGKHVFLVHRLDRATSGAIALVLESTLVEPLQRAFQEGLVDKRYLALARGQMPEHTLVDYALPRGEDPKGERVQARTEFRRLGVYADRYTLVEARPLTGRLHQIRRHLKHLFRPIIGDTTYGDGKENRLFRERFGLMRLALHARSLTLPHPVTGATVRVEAPLPPELSQPFSAMGLWPSSGDEGA